MKYSLSVLFCLLFSSIHGQSSVLSSGTWHKVGITETGIYKLDFVTLQNLGVDLSQPPQTIKVYGNGFKGILPQENDKSRPFDLLENAIFLQGEGDGSFDESDYVLFYGVGPDNVDWTENGLEYEKNIYSDTAYYFITSGGSDGKRILDLPSVSGAGVAISSYNDVIITEDDQTNLLSSGRGWYGEVFSIGETQSFDFDLNNIASNIQFVINAIGQSETPSSFQIRANGNESASLPISSIPSGPGTLYSIKASQTVDTFLIEQTNQLNIQLTYDAEGATGIGFLDYGVLLFERQLTFSGTPVGFRTLSNTGSVLSYQLSNGAGTTIWNVTDPANVGRQIYLEEGSDARFQSQSTNVEEFIVFSGSDFPIPQPMGSVGNQNLKAEVQLDGIIVSHSMFLAEAERLAQFHRDNDNLVVKVVTTSDVYNEFSSGRQDVSAIRDYAKYVYDSGNQLKYLLLFGDCSYDYKSRVANNTNFVPTYESRDSFHPIFSHSSDDYFGFFEDNEGEWTETVSGDHTMEIGMGRLPAKTVEEAAVIVDKIIYYSTSPNTLGKWRNEIAYLADDGDANIHAAHVDALSALIDTTYAQYSIDKLLLDAFDQEVGASTQRSPDATKALKEKIKSGAFAINFIGHGNERLWTEEEVLTRSVIRRFNNLNRLPIFVTATCEFGRYDDPVQFSGAE
ncbi:MAG: type IX secretion system sortase PorU, partial [Bacteroidota bacterium]